jgi:type IV pilus assembly protein PilV
MRATMHQTFRHMPCRPLTQRGASLIEVLVAMLLVALGILAMAAMQINATRFAKTSEFRAMGSLLAGDLADRMRANPEGVMYRTTEGATAVNHYAYVTAYPYDGVVSVDNAAKACNTTTVTCSAADMAAYDMATWRKAVASSLPGGWVRVSTIDTTKTAEGLAENAVDLWLMWVDVDNSRHATESAACPTDVVATPPDDKKNAALPSPRCMYFRINL